MPYDVLGLRTQEQVVIVPLTTENQWSDALTRLPPFAMGDGPLVVISPHPDDETLAAGGLVVAASDCGRDVLVIAVTDGERAYENREGLAQVRIREQEEALRVLGRGKVRMVRLSLPDSSVGTKKSALENALREHIHPGSHVIAPWLRDYHPDHEACGRASQVVAREVGARLSWWYFWTWHRGTPDDLRGMNAYRFPLTEEQLNRKISALSCHRSQLYSDSEDPILPESLLAPAQRPFEVFAAA